MIKKGKELPETVLNIISFILEEIENPLKQKRPNAKQALKEIDYFRSKCNTIREEFKNESYLREKEKSFSNTKFAYKCMYQCGFTTFSIREIDKHLTDMYGHPNPQRDYNHPIYQGN